MSKWSHNICVDCWNEKNPDRAPVKLTQAEAEICCFCGEFTTAGIYIREDGTDLQCKGLCD